jgi:hypothetical protein
MHLDLHLTEGTELRASSRVDDTGHPAAQPVGPNPHTRTGEANSPHPN